MCIIMHTNADICVCVGVFAYVRLCSTGLQEHTEQKNDSARTDGDEAINEPEQDDIGNPFQPDAARWI